ncbi:MAG: PHP domain-containing protein [Myxococcales bacterium]|nr:PHP domain-containing protein [Myxococcales bacterium]
MALGLVLAALGASTCTDESGLLRAKLIEHRAELVGGPVAMADLGDFVIENDLMRAAIRGSVDSPAPGVFGGSLVDLDVRRRRLDTAGGLGHDRFVETFPLANLLVPEPEAAEVRVLADGSDGETAAIRVAGEGSYLFQALGVLRSKQPVLDLLFPNVRTHIFFTTDYILHPGERHLTVRTELRLDESPPPACPDVLSCPPCPYGLAQDDTGCQICECSELLTLDPYTGPANVFGGILGDSPDDPGATRRAGVVAGDFVFFGNQNDVFAPGPGFDEDAAVQGAKNASRNTFLEPLVFDFVAAAGGDVSYGYFAPTPAGAAPTLVNVPLFASAATAFLTGGTSCLFDTVDDVSCDRNRAFVYERYLVVGEGDVASITEEIYRVRGTPTGRLAGHALWDATGEAAPNAHLYLLADPEPGTDWTSLDAVVRRNLETRGDAGVVNALDADRGLDPEEDGDFGTELPAGDYVLVAHDADKVVLSRPYPLHVAVGAETVVVARLPTPARVRYRITDEQGALLPGKLGFTALDDAGRPLEGDGTRRPYLGQGRLGNGLRAQGLSATGEGELAIEPGRYRIAVSHGPEHGRYVLDDVTLAPGALLSVDAVVPRELDTTGWMSADLHLHSTPSFDSGMPIERRVTTIAAEGVDFAVSTDHDVHTDYGPAIRALGLEPRLAHAVGAEVTTLEQGHFIGFPLVYDALTVPTHGAHDWTCEGAGAILAGIRATGDGIEPFTVNPHPRDGFFGYIDQLGVDPYTMRRAPSLLEEENPVFRTASCDMDGMEAMGAKRFDLQRTPTVAEVVDYNRCLGRIDAATSIDELTVACPELGPGLLAPCALDELYARCRDRNRTRLASLMTRRILERTPEEQHADWAWPLTAKDSQPYCDLAALGGQPVPAATRDFPCAYRAGQVDDYFRYLEHGLVLTQIGSSDGHDAMKEPGYPRTFFKSPTDDPRALAVEDAVTALRAGNAFATYGPFVRASISDKTFGETAALPAGALANLLLDVQTASWFGVDRVEVYLNGEMIRLILPAAPTEAVYDVYGQIHFPVPARDSWVVVIAMGLKDENLMSPVSVDIPFGEVQLSKVASEAFGHVPAVSALFSAAPSVPDWSPTIPYAVTNPIFIDTDGNGVYDAPLPYPEFCSRPCDPATPTVGCPSGQTCLEQGVCGLPISGKCIRRAALPMHE